MKTAIGVAFVIAALVGLWLFLHRGSTVEVRNIGTQPMRAVIVHVTGNSYPIGDLPAGASKRVVVKPTGESHVEIEHDARNPLVVDSYIEPLAPETITVEVTPFKSARLWRQ
jgi:hypothetical protein